MSGSPLRFSATMVKNAGAYASGWYWYYGRTMAQVNALLAANNARLITAQRYYDGSWVYAVVMVPNTGTNASDDTFNAVLVSGLPAVHGVVQGIAWFGPSPSSIVNNALAQSERPTLLTSYVLHGTGTQNGDTEWVAVVRDNY